MNSKFSAGALKCSTLIQILVEMNQLHTPSPPGRYYSCKLAWKARVFRRWTPPHPNQGAAARKRQRAAGPRQHQVPLRCQRMGLHAAGASKPVARAISERLSAHSQGSADTGGS